MANNVTPKFESKISDIIELMTDLLVETVHIGKGFTQLNCMDGSIYLYDGEVITCVRSGS